MGRARHLIFPNRPETCSRQRTSVPYHAESTLSSAQVLKLFVAVRSRHFFRVCLCVSVKWLSDSFTAVILPCVRPGSVF